MGRLFGFRASWTPRKAWTSHNNQFTRDFLAADDVVGYVARRSVRQMILSRDCWSKGARFNTRDLSKTADARLRELAHVAIQYYWPFRALMSPACLLPISRDFPHHIHMHMVLPTSHSSPNRAISDGNLPPLSGHHCSQLGRASERASERESPPDSWGHAKSQGFIQRGRWVIQFPIVVSRDSRPGVKTTEYSSKAEGTSGQLVYCWYSHRKWALYITNII